MNKDKIIQIMPAPETMKAIYKDDEGYYSAAPIDCLALMSDGDVTPIVLDDLGIPNQPDKYKNFERIAHLKTADPWHLITLEEMRTLDLPTLPLEEAQDND